MTLINKLNLNFQNFNYKTLLKLVLIVCLFEIKSGSVEFIKYVKTNMKEWLTRVFSLVKGFLNKLKFRKQITNITPYEYKTYSIKVDQKFITNLNRYLENKRENCSYLKSNKIICDATGKDVNIDNTYNNIIINIDKCVYQVNNNITNSNIYSNNVKLVKLDFKTYDTYKINNFYEALILVYQPDLIKTYKYNFTQRTQKKIGVRIIDSSLLGSIMAFLDKAFIFSEAHHNFINGYLQDLKYNIFTIIKHDVQKAKNIINYISKNLENNILVTPYNFNIDISGYTKINNICYIHNVYAEILTSSDTEINDELPIPNTFVDFNEIKSLDTIDIQLINNSTTITDDDQIKILFKEIQKESHHDKKIATYSIKIVDEQEVTEQENPEYKNYLENKELITQMVSKSENVKEILNIPPKTIEKTTTKRVIKCIKVKEQNKGFNTLYLQQADETKLRHMLDNYNSNTFSEFEIPKKIGILLHGLPGTGKSTTIQVIGCHQQKDIYFLELSSVKTCGEAKMLFDYVVNNCNGSGIIVLEDLDAQTPIVHKRGSDIPEKSITNIVEGLDDQFNLSYFLNLLDGSLCAEDTMFIITTNHLEVLDPAIYRVGRVDCVIELRPCDHYQIRKIFKTITKTDIDENLLSKIPEYKFTPAEIIFWLFNNSYNKLSQVELLKKFIQLD